MASEDMFKEYSIDITIDEMNWSFRAETDEDAIEVGDIIEGIVRERIKKVCKELEREVFGVVSSVENTNIETVTAELTTVFSESEHQAVYSTKG